jgi:hypothetical protein
MLTNILINVASVGAMSEATVVVYPSGISGTCGSTSALS